MQLSSNQKDYIKKNARNLSPDQMASDLGLPKKEILNYLRKKWRPEKYQKYLSQFSNIPEIQSFSFRKFFRENVYFFAFFTFLVVITYANSLNNGFVSDDIAGIANNPELGKFSHIWVSLTGILQRLVWFFTFKIFGATPIYFRLFNVFFHLGTVFLIFIIFNVLYGKKWLSFMTAALFAVHPILIESVAWISGHPYIESSFFFLATFLFYLLGRQNKRHYYVSLFLFFFTLSAMDKYFVMCSVFFLYELFFGNLRDYWKKIVPYFILSAVIAFKALGMIGYRISVLQSDYYLAPGTDSMLVKIPTSIAIYFKLIFWPAQLSLYQTEMVFAPWEYWLTVLVFLLYAGLIIYGYFKNRYVSFWLLFFLIPIATTLSPLRIAWAVAERYVYLSTLGILAAVAWIFYKLSEKDKLKIPVYIVFSVIMLSLSIRTIVRNTDWKNEETLWIATEKTSPSGPNIHNNLGAIYSSKGENEKAISEFQLAIAINPGYADAYHNMGNSHYALGQYSEAFQAYMKALEINPRLWQSHQNIASIYFTQGLNELATQEIKKALELNPQNPDLLKNLEILNNRDVQPQLSGTEPGS